MLLSKADDADTHVCRCRCGDAGADADADTEGDADADADGARAFSRGQAVLMCPLCPHRLHTGPGPGQSRAK